MVLMPESKDEIIQYFIDRYGEWVLLEPKKEGINWAVWVLPPIFMLIGLYALYSYTRSRPNKLAKSTDATSENTVEDEYLRAVRDDVLG